LKIRSQNLGCLAENPQFKIKINEQYHDTAIWILLQRHTATPDYEVILWNDFLID